MPELQLLTILIGLFIGTVLALTGAGGTILSIPLLVFFIHLDITEAAPIGLLALTLSATIGTLLGLRAGLVRYRAAMLMALCGMVMAPIGVWLGHQLPNQLVELLFACVLILVSVRMWQEQPQAQTQAQPAEIQDSATPDCQLNPVTSRLFWSAGCTMRLTITGVISGLLSGLIGVGGGFIIVPALRKISNFDLQTIIATSFAVVALISAAGFISFVSHHNPIQWPIAFSFSASVLFAMLAFKPFSAKIPSKITGRLFSALAFTIAIGLLVKAIR